MKLAKLEAIVKYADTIVARTTIITTVTAFSAITSITSTARGPTTVVAGTSIALTTVDSG